MELTRVELAAVKGMMARDRLLQQDIASLNSEYRAILADIATRLDLPPEAIGQTHDIDLDQGIIRAKPTVNEPQIVTSPNGVAATT